MFRTGLLFGLLIFVLGVSISSAEISTPDQAYEPLGIAMENYEYPYPVHFYDMTIENVDCRMAFMDIAPNGESNGRTVILMHGKNFFGAYWEKTIDILAAEGFRVIVPDQVGFGKSSKPNIHYSFHRLSHNTRMLTDELGVDSAVVVGHSMGGMLATRFTLMYPDFVETLVLENPIGLEDYRFKVPYTPIEKAYNNILGYTLEGIRSYHKTYYPEWKEEYDEYVEVHYRWTLGGEYDRLARASALTFEMVYTQPVCHEFHLIEPRTLLILGQEDRTTLGRGQVSDEVLATLGQYPELGKKVEAAIPDCTLIELEGIGHIPHFEATEKFHMELLRFLKN